MSERLIDGYAAEKLGELVFELFIGLGPARNKLSDNLHFIAKISPRDFKLERHRTLWADIQRKLIGKTKNVNLKRAPIERVTALNDTLRDVLTSIWSIYEECSMEAQ